MLSEAEGSPLKSSREGAVQALREVGRRASEREVSTFVMFETHWLSNFGYHINASAHRRGAFTSHEALELWQQGRYREFIDMLPDYATKCNGEGGMADTIILFVALGWYGYQGWAEQLCDCFPSSGSGQVNVEFHVGG